jgi:hypothetical protein
MPDGSPDSANVQITLSGHRCCMFSCNRRMLPEGGHATQLLARREMPTALREEDLMAQQKYVLTIWARALHSMHPSATILRIVIPY